MKCNAYEIEITKGHISIEFDSGDVKIESPRKKAIRDIVEMITIHLLTDAIPSELVEIYEPDGWKVKFRCRGDEDYQEYENVRFAGATLDIDNAKGIIDVTIEMAVII